MTRTIATIIAFAVLLLSGCAKTVTTPTTPAAPTTSTSGLTKATIALDLATTACEIAANDVTSPAAIAWLNLCPAAIQTTSNALAATNGISVTQAVIQGLMVMAKSAPVTSSLPAGDATKISNALIAINSLITILQQSQAAPATAKPPAASSSFFGATKDPNPSKLKEIHKRADKLKKKLQKKAGK